MDVGAGMKLPPKHSRLLGYMDARGWGEASTRIMPSSLLCLQTVLASISQLKYTPLRWEWAVSSWHKSNQYTYMHVIPINERDNYFFKKGGVFGSVLSTEREERNVTKLYTRKEKRFLLFLVMCMPNSVCGTCGWIQTLVEPVALDTPEAWFANNCEFPNMGAKNWIWIH